LIDARTYPYDLTAAATAQVVWLDGTTTEPLRFNRPVRLKVISAAHCEAGAAIPPPAPGAFLWVRPLATASTPTTPTLGAIYTLDPALTSVQGEVQLATCAGPRLLHEGTITNRLGDPADPQTPRALRTAVGCDAAGRRLWVLVLTRGLDGRPGVTLRETAETLRALGAVEGLNLDGGSSCSVWSGDAPARAEALCPQRMPIHHALVLRRHAM